MITLRLRTASAVRLIVLPCVLGLPAALHAQLVVDAGGGGTHSSIQAAIDDAADGDTIIVRPGVYDERIDFLGKRLHVRSVAPRDPAVTAATIIDGEDLGPVVSMVGAEPAGTSIEGLTIRNGNAPLGGGVYCANGARPSIRYCRIVENFSALHGGGVHFADGVQASLVACEVSGNVCEGRGGGVYVDSAKATIARCVIRENRAGCSSGGGVHLGRGSDASVIIFNEISGNQAIHGGGVQVEDASPRFQANRVVGNWAGARGGGLSIVDGAPRVDNNVIAGNLAAIASAAECNNASVRFESNTFVGNLALQAGVILALNGSEVVLAGNIIAHHPAGYAVQAVSGASVTVEYCCLFNNAGGDSSGAAVLGAGNVFADPRLMADGSWTAGPPRYGPVCGGVVVLSAILSGPGTGQVSYRFGPDQTRFEVDVRDYPSGIHEVAVDGVVVGQLAVDDRGRGRLRFDTLDGTLPPGFPMIAADCVVAVGAIASGTLTSVGPVADTVWSPGDFHLSAGSPCIDAFSGPAGGSSDVDGQPRLAGLAADIGADERTAAGSGDADGDGDVDLRDLARVQWCFEPSLESLRDPACAAMDLNADARIDGADWAAVSGMIDGPS